MPRFPSSWALEQAIEQADFMEQTLREREAEIATMMINDSELEKGWVYRVARSSSVHVLVTGFEVRRNRLRDGKRYVVAFGCLQQLDGTFSKSDLPFAAADLDVSSGQRYAGVIPVVSPRSGTRGIVLR